MDAARRQLRTAIELWFNDGDPVSIHTLAHSAHEVIHRLFRNAGHSDLLFDTTYIKDEHRADFAKWLKADVNFFKHATNEHSPAASKEFDPEVNFVFLLMSVLALDAMKEPRGEAENCFMVWCLFRRPQWFPKAVVENMLPSDLVREWRELNRKDFFAAFTANMAERRRLGFDARGRKIDPSA